MSSNNSEVEAHEQLCEAIHAAAEAGVSTFNYSHNYDLKLLPEDIKVLKPLEILHIDSCYQLSVLPPAVGDLTNLRWLNVSYNSLTELPPEIGKLRHLERLHCNNNKLVSLPIEVWALREMNELRCDTNKISAFPTGVLWLPKLKDFFVENNKLLVESDVDGAEAAELLPPVRSGDCSNCRIRFTRAICFVTFHTCCGATALPFAHYVCSSECEQQLRMRLVAFDKEGIPASPSPSPKK